MRTLNNTEVTLLDALQLECFGVTFRHVATNFDPVVAHEYVPTSTNELVPWFFRNKKSYVVQQQYWAVAAASIKSHADVSIMRQTSHVAAIIVLDLTHGTEWLFPALISDLVTDLVTHLFKLIIQSGIVPTDFACGVIIPLVNNTDGDWLNLEWKLSW